MKVCIKCKLEKEENRFKHKSFRCDDCISEYQRNYREENKESAKKYFRIYYKENRNTILENVKENTSNNKEKIATYKSAYYKENEKKLKEYIREYYKENKERLNSNSSRYRKLNRRKINDKRNESNKFNRSIISEKERIKRNENPVYRISHNIRSYIRNSVKIICEKSNIENRKSKTQEILGCSFEEFKLYLESKFEPWMNWNNYGKYNGEMNYGWDIDHIIPLSTAKIIEDVYKLNHFKNLQPLCSHTNRYIKCDNLY